MVAKNPNVIFLTVDTLRADHLGCYDYFRNTTPNIDKVAEDGVLFKNSFSSAIATGPSYTSMITGKANINHKYYITPFKEPNTQQLNDLIPTLAEVMQQNGYVTAAFDNMLSWRSHPKHFARGYNFYINVNKKPIGFYARISTKKITDMINDWLEYSKSFTKPFFLFVHYWLPHTPYNQPKKYRQIYKHEVGDRSDLKIDVSKDGYKFVRGWGPLDSIVEGESRFIRPYYNEKEQIVSIDLYDGAIRYIDGYIGEVINTLKKLDIYSDILLIITSDHGEALGQHNMWAHGSIYDHTIHIPIIIKHPDFNPGKKVRGYVQHVDLFPTIQELTGSFEWPEFDHYSNDGDDPSLDGFSLLPLVASNKNVREKIFFEGGVLRGIRTDDWKLIKNFRSNKVELYNICRDSMEVNDLAKEYLDIKNHMERELTQWIESNLGEHSDPVFNTQISHTCEVGKLNVNEGFYQ